MPVTGQQVDRVLSDEVQVFIHSSYVHGLPFSSRTMHLYTRIWTSHCDCRSRNLCLKSLNFNVINHIWDAMKQIIETEKFSTSLSSCFRRIYTVLFSGSESIKYKMCTSIYFRSIVHCCCTLFL